MRTLATAVSLSAMMKHIIEGAEGQGDAEPRQAERAKTPAARPRRSRNAM